jgi:hypothetical protein
MLTVFSNQKRVSNDALKLELAQYVAAYIQEELDRGVSPRDIGAWLISDAFDAYQGGAR